WLASAYDAWVCRPGVPSTPLAAPSVASKITTTGDIVLSGGPNLTLLRAYVVNTGNDGRLSSTGKFVSTAGQLDEIFTNMAVKHAAWTAEDHTTDRHVLLYAHGGVIDEFGGLGIAQQQLGWWLQNHVYPISFCWESGALETIGDSIGDLLHRFLPFGGIRFDFEEHADRLVEWTARRFAAALWQEMKGNAEGASTAEGPGDIRGGTEIGRRLQDYIARHPEANIRIHLAGHSAGTIFLCSLVERLTEMGLPIESVAFMGGAATNADFAAKVLPAFVPRPGKGAVKRFTTFDLSERMEQDDTCALGDNAWYHKSLLYLVARGLEPNPDPRTGMVPQTLAASPVREAAAATNGAPAEAGAGPIAALAMGATVVIATDATETPAAIGSAESAAVVGPAVLALPEIRIPAEAAISPKSSSPAFDVLRANGYTFEDESLRTRSDDDANGNGAKGTL